MFADVHFSDPWQCSSESAPEWESHIDNQGELFYVQFSSNLHPPSTTEVTKERQPSNEERQEVLKKKKKSKQPHFQKRLCFWLDPSEVQRFSFCVVVVIRSFEPSVETESSQRQQRSHAGGRDAVEWEPRLFANRNTSLACRWLVWLDLVYTGARSSSYHWSGRQLVKVSLSCHICLCTVRLSNLAWVSFAFAFISLSFSLYDCVSICLICLLFSFVVVAAALAGGTRASIYAKLYWDLCQEVPSRWTGTEKFRWGNEL